MSRKDPRKKLIEYFIVASATGIVFSIILFGIVITKSINFDRFCGDYLKRAADSNNIQLAKEELTKALIYIEKNNLTTGFTSVFYNTPDEDIEFWYTNIKTTKTELDNLPVNSSSLEKSNMLLKLRETLLDNGPSGKTVVTIPSGISTFPHNTKYMFLYILCGIHGGIISILGILLIATD